MVSRNLFPVSFTACSNKKHASNEAPKRQHETGHATTLNLHLYTDAFQKELKLIGYQAFLDSSKKLPFRHGDQHLQMLRKHLQTRPLPTAEIQTFKPCQRF